MDDPNDRLPVWARSLIDEAWIFVRDFEELARRVAEFLAAGIRAFEAGLTLFFDAVKLVADHPLGMLLGTAGAASVVSPLTDAYGLDSMAGWALGIWTPLVAWLSLLFGLGIVKGLRALNREADRDTRRQQRETTSTESRSKLAADEARRRSLNAALVKARGLPRLEDLPFVPEEMAKTLNLIRSRDRNTDTALVLGRWKRGFSVRLWRGTLDSEVKQRLELGNVFDDGFHERKELRARLDDLQYRAESIMFQAGHRTYLLIAVSGATIPESAVEAISDATVELVEAYVRLVAAEEFGS